MQKLNLKGFAHWIIPALVVAVIGGIGTYLVIGSHALVPTPNGGGKATHSELLQYCKNTSYAQVNLSDCLNAIGGSVIVVGIDHGGSFVKTDKTSGFSSHGHTRINLNDPNFAYSKSGNWKFCDDSFASKDFCTKDFKRSHVTNLCDLYINNHTNGSPNEQHLNMERVCGVGSAYVIAY